MHGTSNRRTDHRGIGSPARAALVDLRSPESHSSRVGDSFSAALGIFRTQNRSDPFYVSNRRRRSFRQAHRLRGIDQTIGGELERARGGIYRVTRSRRRLRTDFGHVADRGSVLRAVDQRSLCDAASRADAAAHDVAGTRLQRQSRGGFSFRLFPDPNQHRQRREKRQRGDGRSGARLSGAAGPKFSSK